MVRLGILEGKGRRTEVGADARWVCHTCKTVCSRGGRPIFQSTDIIKTRSGVQVLKEELSHIAETLIIDDYDSKVRFLDDLSRWLERHETHDIHIGSDYSTDMMDIDDYFDETVEGKVSKITRHEVQMGCLQDFEANAIADIESLLQACTTGAKSVKDAARELYNRFSVGNL